MRLHTPAGLLSFISTTTVFGTPIDVTVSELAIESFFPADAPTAEDVRRLFPAKCLACKPAGLPLRGQLQQRVEVR
jgi:hypothetical protein